VLGTIAVARLLGGGTPAAAVEDGAQTSSRRGGLAKPDGYIRSGVIFRAGVAWGAIQSGDAAGRTCSECTVGGGACGSRTTGAVRAGAATATPRSVSVRHEYFRRCKRRSCVAALLRESPVRVVGVDDVN